ncbi:MAG TPA: glycosyltransferase family 39 protein [Pyrinomonadaceae bacterium]
MASTSSPFLVRHRWPIALVLISVLGLVLYTRKLTTNPRGFFIDESSIAYNAQKIAQTGRDEFGIAWPLYFRAFGEYKNPVYIYLLAGIYRISGPSILGARLLSAFAGLATAALLGLLAFRLTRRRRVALFISASALLTPWLFELSRVVVEVSLYPLALTLFLISVHRASGKSKWTWRELVPLALTLALLTYTYSIGRLLAPLLAIGLVLFIRRVGWKSLAGAWASYALTLVPLVIFNLRNPGALTARFSLITYFKSESSLGQWLVDFLRHYVSNINPWRLLVTGDPNEFQMAHVHGTEFILAATSALALIGAWLVWRKNLDSWWVFICYGLIVSIIPASLTVETFHMLHLSPVPVFLLLLAIPAVDWLSQTNSRRRTLIALAILTLLQAALFQWRYAAAAESAWRLHVFDADYPKAIFEPALANNRGPIYLSDASGIPGYIQAYWYATLRGVPLTNFVHLPVEQAPPVNALVITTKNVCAKCNIVGETPPYTLYVATDSPTPRVPLPDDGFRAEVNVINAPVILSAGQRVTLDLSLKNISGAPWPGRQWHADPFQIAVGNHWLDAAGNVVSNDDGRTALEQDLRPGETMTMRLVVNAPAQRGDYILEIDVVQEGVSWFSLKGSKTWRARVKVN